MSWSEYMKSEGWIEYLNPSDAHMVQKKWRELLAENARLTAELAESEKRGGMVAGWLRQERDALATRCGELEADKARLDWLEATLRDENRWADISMKYDDEDGFWLSRIERGIVLTERNYEPADPPVKNVNFREALDAAIKGEKP